MLIAYVGLKIKLYAYARMLYYQCIKFFCSSAITTYNIYNCNFHYMQLQQIQYNLNYITKLQIRFNLLFNFILKAVAIL